jgi:hypothetical protein
MHILQQLEYFFDHLFFVEDTLRVCKEVLYSIFMQVDIPELDEAAMAIDGVYLVA